MRKDIPAKKYRSGKTARMMAAALTADATACCQQVMEFELAGGQDATEFLSAEEEITVVGTFDTYMEGEYMYCTLRNAELVG